MKLVLTRLWNEQDGAILSSELLLIGSILVIGAIVGLSAVRDSVVTELADVAQALANFDQSYSVSAVVGHHSFTGGGFFNDQFDFCDTCDNAQPRHDSKCVVICEFGHGGETWW